MRTQKEAGDVACKHCGGWTPGTIERRFLNNPRDVFARGDVIDLAEAVRQKDVETAEHLLDRRFGDHEVVRDWLSQGRHSA